MPCSYLPSFILWLIDLIKGYRLIWPSGSFSYKPAISSPPDLPPHYFSVNIINLICRQMAFNKCHTYCTLVPCLNENLYQNTTLAKICITIQFFRNCLFHVLPTGCHFWNIFTWLPQRRKKSTCLLYFLFIFLGLWPFHVALIINQSGFVC